MSAEQRVRELGLVLPEPARPVASYAMAVRTGRLLFVSGHLPVDEDGQRIVGRVGEELTVEQAAAAARRVGLAMLATLRDVLGSLDKVKRIVKVVGLVNAVDGFAAQPQVLNGFSDLMAEVFGEAGVHARFAGGTSNLPGGVCCEIEAIVEVGE
jgi:enamine deaminase RidA (YjgF/YER057c/UK114 family)